MPLNINYRENCQLQTPTEEFSTGEKKKKQLQDLTGKDAHCVSHMESTTHATWPMRNHYHPLVSLFSKGLSFQTSPPNFLLLLHQVTFLSFGCWTCLWFCFTLIILNCKSAIPKETHFAGKNNYFKVSMTWCQRSRIQRRWSTIPRLVSKQAPVSIKPTE